MRPSESIPSTMEGTVYRALIYIHSTPPCIGGLAPRIRRGPDCADVAGSNVVVTSSVAGFTERISRDVAIAFLPFRTFAVQFPLSGALSSLWLGGNRPRMCLCDEGGMGLT